MVFLFLIFVNRIKYNRKQITWHKQAPTHTLDQIQMLPKIYRTYTDNSGRKLVREIHTTVCTRNIYNLNLLQRRIQGTSLGEGNFFINKITKIIGVRLKYFIIKVHVKNHIPVRNTYRYPRIIGELSVHWLESFIAVHYSLLLSILLLAHLPQPL